MISLYLKDIFLDKKRVQKVFENSNFYLIKFRLLTFAFTLFSFPSFAYSLFPDTALVRSFGGKGMDIGRDIQVCSDGGFIIVGTTSSFGAGNTGIYLIKTDSNGIYKWSKSIGGIGIEWGYSVKQTFDHGFAIVGYTNSIGAGGYDMYLVKTDSIGNTLWEKTYGGVEWDFGYCIQQLPDSGFIVGGETYSFGNGSGDAFVVRTDKMGDTLWTRAIGGLKNDLIRSSVIVDSNTYAFTGETQSLGNGKVDIFFIKLDGNGNTLTMLGLGTTKNDIGNSIEKTMSGNLVILGESDSLLEGNRDELLMNITPQGSVIWIRMATNFKGTEVGYCVKEKSNGNLLTCGSTNSVGTGGIGLHMMMLNESGYWISGPVFGGGNDEEGYSLCITPTKKVAYVGYTSSYGQGLQDVYLVILKKDSIVMNYTLRILQYNDTNLSPLEVRENIKSSDVSLFPNPMIEAAELKIAGELLRNNSLKMVIYDAAGRMVREQEIYSTLSSICRGGLSSGIYFFRILSSKLNTDPLLLTSGKLIITD